MQGVRGLNGSDSRRPRRRLPHDYQTDQPVLLTWRLHDSLPCHRAFPSNSGQAFAAMDGPRHPAARTTVAGLNSVGEMLPAFL